MDTCGESDYGMMCLKYSILQCTLPIHFAHERNDQTPLNDNVMCVVLYVIYVTL